MSGFAFSHPLRRIGLAALSLASALVVAGTLMAQPMPGGGCLHGGEMRRAVSSGEARPLGSIMRRIGGGQVVRAALCRGHGGLVYRVAVLKGARVEEFVIDARSGQIIRRR